MIAYLLVKKEEKNFYFRHTDGADFWRRVPDGNGWPGHPSRWRGPSEAGICGLLLHGCPGSHKSTVPKLRPCLRIRYWGIVFKELPSGCILYRFIKTIECTNQSYTVYMFVRLIGISFAHNVFILMLLGGEIWRLICVRGTFERECQKRNHPSRKYY